MNILIAGGTGLIGRKLTEQLITKENNIVILSRKERSNSGDALKFLKWDGKEIPQTDIDFDVLINLAGEGVRDKPWTLARKKQIIESRTAATFAFVDYINAAKKKPKIFLNASAVGFYGNRGGNILTEESEHGEGFLADVCKQWEKAASFSSIRTVLLRTGIVLANEGGAFKEIMRSYGFGFGAWFGSGSQGFPWIHIADEIGLILFAMENKNVSGALNLSAPELLSNKAFIKKLGSVSGKRIAFPAPSFALELALGERAQVLLDSQFVKPEKALTLGYPFKFPDAEGAIIDLLSSP
jgi:uncharacterized protein (TIGR01777 family)